MRVVGSTQTQASSAALASALSYLQEHFREPHTGEHLEAKGGSARQLQRLFFETLGTSPLDYVNRLRLNEARVLLGNGTLSLAEVARSVGYANAACFCHEFRQRYGISPEDFRRMVRAEAPENELASELNEPSAIAV